MCYDCGSRKRNLPFKLCGVCYQSRRQSNNSVAAVPSGISLGNGSSNVASSATYVPSAASDGVKDSDDSGSQEDEVDAVGKMCIESDSEGKQSMSRNH